MGAVSHNGKGSAVKARDQELAVADNEDTDDSEFTETAVWEANAKQTDNVGEASVQLNVEELIAEFEAESSRGIEHSSRVRRRLEAIAERKRRHRDLMDWDDYDVDN